MCSCTRVSNWNKDHDGHGDGHGDGCMEENVNDNDDDHLIHAESKLRHRRLEHLSHSFTE